jgi:hypothetical protein
MPAAMTNKPNRKAPYTQTINGCGWILGAIGFVLFAVGRFCGSADLGGVK